MLTVKCEGLKLRMAEIKEGEMHIDKRVKM